jgi:hypothetical protein
MLSLSASLLMHSVLSSKETGYVTTHVKKSCVLIIKAWALIRNTIVDRMISYNFSRVSSVELVLQICPVLRKMCLVALWVSRCTM